MELPQNPASRTVEAASTPVPASMTANNENLQDSSLEYDPLATRPPVTQQPEITLERPQQRRRWRLILGSLVAALIIIGAIAGLISLHHPSKEQQLANSSASERYGSVSVPLNTVPIGSANLATASTIDINGRLNIKNSLVLTPSVQPSTGVAGQLYFDKQSKQLKFYDGLVYDAVATTNNTVSSLGGAHGAISLGAGLSLNNNILSSNTVAAVSNVQGSPGVLKVSGGTNISVASDGKGGVIVSSTISNGSVTGNGTGGTIALFDSAQNLTNSLLSQAGSTVTVGGNLAISGNLTLGAPLAVSQGGTGLANLNANQLIYASSSTSIDQLSNGATGQCLISNGVASTPNFQTCPGAGVSGVSSVNGQTGAISFNGTANQVIISGSGNSFTLSTPQDLATTSAVSFGTLDAATLIKTNGTSRIDASGNLTNIGTVSASGLISGAAGLTIGGGNITLNNLSGGSSQCLTLDALNVVGVASCGSSDPTLQNVYDNSGTAPTINLSTSGKGLFVQDAATPIGGSLLAVRDSSGTTSYFAVTTAGASVIGNFSATSLSGDGNAISNVNATLLNGQASSYYLNASNINAGTLGDSYLSTNVTLQGNSFNGANQLVKLSPSGLLPALDGSQLTNLNATNIASGTVNDARLSANVALYNNATANFTGALQQGGYGVCTTIGNCTGSGSGGAIGGNGTANTIALFTGGGYTIGDSLLSQDSGATAVTVDGDLAVNGSVTAPSFSGSGSGLTSLNASNLSSGTVLSTRLSGTYSGVSGVGTLTTGSLGSGFGAISTANSIATTADIQANAVYTTSGLLVGGTSRIDASGNLVNIGSATTTGLITAGSGLTVASGAITLSNLTGGSSTCLTLDASNVVGVSSCATGTGSTPTLQNVYDNSGASPFINLNTTGHGVAIQDAATPVGGSLFSVANSSGSSKYLNVNAGGVTASYFSGDGGGLTNVNAATLDNQAGSYYLNASNINAGTLGDSYLSNNVALYNSATANFTGALQQAGYTVCTTAGNCVGSGGSGGIGGGGTANKVALFTAGGYTIGDSILSQDGGATTVTVTGDLSVSGTISGNGSGLTALNASNVGSGTLGDSYLSSNVALRNADNNFTGTLLQHNGQSVCDTSGNCVGTGASGAVGGSGTANTIALFTGSGYTIGNSILAQNALGTTVIATGNLTASGALNSNNLSTGSAGQFTVDGGGNVTTTAIIQGGSFSNSGGSFSVDTGGHITYAANGTGTSLACTNGTQLTACDATILTPTNANFIRNQTGVQTTANFNIDGTGTASILQASTLKGGSTYQFGVDINGNVSTSGTSTVANTSTSAFRVQTSGGGSTLLNADTSAGRVSVGSVGTSTSQLYISGTLPTLVGQNSDTNLGNPNSVVTQGNYAFVTDLTNSKLLSYDITRGVPVYVGQNSDSNINKPRPAAIKGRYVYVPNFGNGKLNIYDISSGIPVFVSQNSDTNMGNNTAQGVAVQGKYAYVVTNSKVFQYDVSTNVPIYVSQNSDTNLSGGAGLPVIQGKYLFVGTSGGGKLLSYDISGSVPVFVGQNIDTTAFNPKNLSVVGRYLYAADSSTGKLNVYDISSGIPLFVSQNSDSNMIQPNSVSVQGRFAYVGDTSSGKIDIYDITSGTPVFVGQNSDNSLTSVGKFSIQGRYLYAGTTGSNKIVKYDLGGGYVQQLESGGAEFGQLNVDGEANFSGLVGVQGGLSVGQSLQVNGDVGIGGSINASKLITANAGVLVTTSSVTALSIANAGSANVFLKVDTTGTGTITLGDSTSGNYITFTAVNGLQAFGTARHTKNLTLTAQYAGAVLDSASDASCSAANSGSTSNGFDGSNYVNYYKWTSTSTAQCNDIVVRVPIPTDFDIWSSTTPLTIMTYTSNTTSGTIKVDARTTSNAAEAGCTYVTATPATTNTWTSSGSACTIAGTYTAGGIMTLRLRLTGDNASDVRVGNITLSYKSKF